jgi:hypothetical protein
MDDENVPVAGGDGCQDAWSLGSGGAVVKPCGKQTLAFVAVIDALHCWQGCSKAPAGGAIDFVPPQESRRALEEIGRVHPVRIR